MRAWCSSSSSSGKSLISFIEKPQLSCLNESGSHNVRSLFESSGYLESDADEQLLISLPTMQIVKIRAIKFKTHADHFDKAPKTVKLYVDQMNLGFDDAEVSSGPITRSREESVNKSFLIVNGAGSRARLD